MERRRCERIPLSLAFDVYDGGRHLGRFWTRDLSQDGLFLKAHDPNCLTNTILSLRFHADGMEYCVRGIGIRRVHRQGAGIQLAFWRHGDEDAYAAYRKLIQADTDAG